MTDAQANARKRLVDGMAATLLNLDKVSIRQNARTAADVIKEAAVPHKIVICGGAGANKSTFAKELSREIEAPAFDLDEFIKGGYTENVELYRRNLNKAKEEVWEALPSHMWIIEHVECCSPALVKFFSPTVAILLEPGMAHLSAVAQVRDLVGENTNGWRKERALETAKKARTHFDALKGTVTKFKGLEIKILV